METQGKTTEKTEENVRIETMAEAGTMAVNADVEKKAGAGVSATSIAEAYTNEYILQAESYLNALCRHNYTDNYLTLNVDVKYILSEAVSNLAAIYAIQYDVSGYNSTREAENIINTNWARFMHCIQLLQDQPTNTYIQNA